MESKNKLKRIFNSLQDQMISSLRNNRKNITHPGTKGAATENRWRKLLNDYLPERYKAEPAFVIDSNGNISEQIDIVIFDRQYSPFLFNQDGVLYIPAESVYATIEVKQEINKSEIEYAGKKAASVRKLLRTSAPIPHAGGTFSPKKPFNTLSVFLAAHSTWKNPFANPFKRTIKGLKLKSQIDLGCIINEGSFLINYSQDCEPEFSVVSGENHLMFFFFTLLSKLQALGTAPAVNFEKYAELIKRNQGMVKNRKK
jgi:hypothetical protein